MILTIIKRKFRKKITSINYFLNNIEFIWTESLYDRLDISLGNGKNFAKIKFSKLFQNNFYRCEIKKFNFLNNFYLFRTYCENYNIINSINFQ